jgi:signal transduction histidine kinase
MRERIADAGRARISSFRPKPERVFYSLPDPRALRARTAEPSAEKFVPPAMLRAPSLDSDAARLAAYEAENLELCRRGGRSVCFLWIGLIPLFLLVDFARFPNQAPDLLWMRIGYFFVPITFLAAFYTDFGRRASRWLVLLYSVVGGLVTFAMLSQTGGHGSSYYAGVGLIMLGTALLVPWPAIWTWATCGALMASYVAYGLLFEPIGDGRLFANNLVSYAATAAIAGIATMGRARLRQREFESRFELERSRDLVRERAAVSTALARAGGELITSLEAPRILDRLCQVTTEVLACDVSHTIMFDERHEVWRGVSQHGDSAEAWERLRGIEVRTEQVATLLDRLSTATVVQLQLPADEAGAMNVAARTGITRTMIVALRHGGKIVGVHTAAFRGRTDPFSEAQEGLMAGLAQLASMALANARLHEALALQTEAERAARAEAELANLAKDEFLATLSHELRTPLNVIVGYTEMIQDPDLPRDEREPILGSLDLAARQLVDMISDTLEISRLQAGRLQVQLERLPLAALWSEVRSLCARLPKQPGVSLRWRLAVPSVELATDRRLLIVMVRNLVANALKFTERGSVEVSAELETDGLVLRVADTGIGIAADHQARIFDMFQQLDSSDTRSYGGVGLGLYIVRRFAAELGAQVAVDSAPGRGSIFIVRLPRDSCALRAA